MSEWLRKNAFAKEKITKISCENEKNIRVKKIFINSLEKNKEN